MADSYSALELVLSSGEIQAHRLFPANLILDNLRSYNESPDVLLTCYNSLAEYSFDEIKIDAGYKRMLARLLAHTWLISRARFDTIYRFSLPFSLLLDQKYEFDFDEQKIMSELFSCPPDTVEYPKLSKHPFRYDERQSIFPELKKLSKLPLPTKFTFALLVLKADYITGFLPEDSIPGITLFTNDFDVLERKGLLITRPAPMELIGSFGYADLRRFAEKMGVYVFKKRDDIIREIKLKVPLPEIEKFVHANLEIMYPLMPKMMQLPVLRKFMLDEANRLNIYLEWVAFKLCGLPSIISPVMASRSLPGDVFLNVKHKKSEYLENRNQVEQNLVNYYNPEDMRVVQSVWDSHCEEIVQNTGFEDGMNQLVNHLFDTGSVEELRRKLFRNNKYWKEVLKAFVDSKYREKIRLSSKMIKCNGCGNEFREYSVTWYFAQSVNGNVQFCQFCYEKILAHEYRANNTRMAQQSDSMMLNNLLRLSQSLERIPTLEFMKKFPLPLPSHPTRKQISVGNVLLKMPSQGLYVKRFGSWLKSLELAGVLEEGYRKTARGIQVIAKDGHICLSLGEKVVDDWLSVRGVLHEKEPKYPFHADINPKRLLRADWKVQNTLIEYAGLMEDYEYSLKMKKKKSLADALNLNVVVLTEKDLNDLRIKLGKLLMK